MQATTRGAVLRGSAAAPDEFGEPVDDNTTPAAGYDDLPLAITERGRTVFDPSTGEPRTVRKITGRLPGYVVLQEGDRVRDNRTMIVYTIEEHESQPRSVSGRSSLTLDLKRVSS